MRMEARVNSTAPAMMPTYKNVSFSLGRPRVFPGKRLPGHMGCVRVTVQNLTVVKVDTENNLIAVKGAVPGSKGTIITLANSVKA